MRIRPAEEKICVDETMAWLHTVWLLTEQERPLRPDPFYERNNVLTPAVVKQVIADLEGIFASEIEKYPGYHRTHQEISQSEYLVPPGFNWLPPSQQLAIVQGIDRIFQCHRMTPEEMAAEEAEQRVGYDWLDDLLEPASVNSAPLTDDEVSMLVDADEVCD